MFRQVFSTILFALLVSLPVLVFLDLQQPLVLLTLAAFYVLAAFLLRSRLILCMLAGLVFGLLAIDTKSSHQSVHYQVWQPIWSIGAGVLIGLAVGFIWDRGATMPERSEPTKKKR